jgi:hypothetical protein
LPSIYTVYIEFINLIEIMNQTSIWIDKTLAVNLYAIATRVVMIAETSSTVLRSTATDRQQESLASMAINSVLIAQEPLGKAGRQLFRMAFNPPSSAKCLAERRKKILMRVHAHG